MTGSKDSEGSSEYGSKVCETPKDAIQGRSARDLNESEVPAEGSERCVE